MKVSECCAVLRTLGATDRW